MKLILTLFAISTVVVGIAFVMTLVQLSPDNLVILRFDQAGQDIFNGSRADLLLMLGTGGGMLLINLFLANVFNKREHFTALVISNFSLILSILLFIATSVIIVNNK